MSPSISINILTEAPVPGIAKRRFAMMLGIEGAARLQRRLVERAIEAAQAAAIGPVTLWGEPHIRETVFAEYAARYGIAVKELPKGGDASRIASVLRGAVPALAISPDSPALSAALVRAAGKVISEDADTVIYPSQSGRLLLIGMRAFVPEILDGVGAENLAADLRLRLAAANVVWREHAPLWALERPSDFRQLVREGFPELAEIGREAISAEVAARA